MKKSLVSGAVAILVAMNLTGCGEEKKIETGTYTCSKEGEEETMQMAFDMEKHTYDMISNGQSLMDNPAMKMAGVKLIVGPYNEKTEEYELITDMKNPFGNDRIKEVVYLKRNGDEFAMRKGKEPAEKMTCIKEEK